MYICVYIYIYKYGVKQTEREREREKQKIRALSSGPRRLGRGCQAPASTPCFSARGGAWETGGRGKGSYKDLAQGLGAFLDGFYKDSRRRLFFYQDVLFSFECL